MAYDSPCGFICKGCGEFFTNQGVEHWDTKWSPPDEEGHRRILHQKCRSAYNKQQSLTPKSAARVLRARVSRPFAVNHPQTAPRYYDEAE